MSKDMTTTPAAAKEIPENQEPTELPVPTRSKTRISTAWVMAVGFILGLILLLIFILQNLRNTYIHFFNLHWDIPLGVAMLLAAVVGGFLVALFGTARVVQLGRRLKRNKS
jgi:uncharacterized integral membrane protein